MRVLYRILQLFAIILIGPFVLVKAIFKGEFRKVLVRRLGLGFGKTTLPAQGPRVWIHALSLGESVSAQGLIRLLKERRPDIFLIFSATTRSGEEYAQKTFLHTVDHFVPFPFDTHGAVCRMLDLVKPDFFIQVETDFWPNFLFEIKKRQIPAVLVNGRISDISWKWYRRAKIMSVPVFDSFSVLGMQSAEDVKRMVSIGINRSKVKSFGNLKYEAYSPPESQGQNGVDLSELGIPAGSRVWVAGSTHIGEEPIIFEVMQHLLAIFPDLFLIIAPRKVERGLEIEQYAEKLGLLSFRRTSQKKKDAQVLVLDTLGELSNVYRVADIAFIGGSLVDGRGHNPLEPASLGKPVLFGPHMEDFPEISKSLLDSGGALEAGGSTEIFHAMKDWLSHPDKAKMAGLSGAALVKSQKGVTERHVMLIEQLLEERGQREKEA